MNEANSQIATLAESAQRCFQESFDGKIAIYCNSDQRGTPTGAGDPKKMPPTAALVIDGFQSPPEILIASAHPPQISELPVRNYCEWRASPQSLQRIFDGGRHLVSAIISGRLSVSGDMAVMMRLTLKG